VGKGCTGEESLINFWFIGFFIVVYEKIGLSSVGKIISVRFMKCENTGYISELNFLGEKLYKLKE
jgi:hypothetical protein